MNIKHKPDDQQSVIYKQVDCMSLCIKH